ncbi:AfsR/SARP family transcriptional regulator [Actinoplanes sp. NPDC023936]|uniref:AfsR/SARP family transcriptional regulator n=1 Tax=Actinoplanes sp. NPDC023936 TaxID=3154910 RepID=UPI0033E6D8B0
MIHYRILGPLEVEVDGASCTPTAPKNRQVLALLLLNAGRVLPIESFIEELWDANPPASAVTTTQTYMYQLRKILHGKGGSREPVLLTRAPGYLLRVQQGQTDVESFDRIAAQGRAMLAAGEVERAAERLSQALNLWRGPAAMPDVSRGPLLQANLAALEERRIRVLYERIEADLMLGRYAGLMAELRRLVAERPLDEWLHCRLMAALYGLGRRGEALTAYHQASQVLQEHLGLDPSAELRQMQRLVLAGRPLETAPARSLVS